MRWKSTCFIHYTQHMILYTCHTHKVLEKMYRLYFSLLGELNLFIPFLTENVAMRRKVVTASTTISVFEVIRIPYEILKDKK